VSLLSPSLSDQFYFLGFSLYRQEFKKMYGEPTGALLITQVEQMVEKMRENGVSVEMEMLRDQMIIAFVTPLMRRVLELVKHSGELVFMDATGTLERHNCRISLLLTHSSAGGLPVGCLVVTSEARDVVQKALEMYTNLLDEKSFYARGKKDPQLFLTDDCLAERQALAAVFPEAVLLLCTFHILQAFWRYLWDSKHGVAKEDRPHLFYLLKKMLLANSEADLHVAFDEANHNAIIQRLGSTSYMLQYIIFLTFQIPQSEEPS
jgi:hypothetical protein